MIIFDKKDASEGGTYLIINLVKWEAYIGETEDLLRRADNYKRDLKRNRGDANDELQIVFNNGDGLLWCVLAYGNESKKIVGNYRDIESFYIAFFKEKGFKIYNDKQKNVTLISLYNETNNKDDIKFLAKNAPQEVDNDFKARFGYALDELKAMSLDDRCEVWNRYSDNIKALVGESHKNERYLILEKE